MGFPWRQFEADGAQIEEFVRRYPGAKIIKMTGIFATHNERPASANPLRAAFIVADNVQLFNLRGRGRAVAQ